MTRKNKFILNTILSLINQLILIVSGLLLPRAIIGSYGSNINGMLSSITQFLGFISFLQAGVGVVVQSSLYKPIANNDVESINKIYYASKMFFRKIAYIFLAYTLLVALIYPNLVKINMSKTETFWLVIVISVNLFAQYYFGINNSILLNADQKAYIPLSINTFTVIVNTAVCLIMISLGWQILIVKLISNLVCLIYPVGLNIYVNRNYNLSVINDSDFSGILNNKWSGFAQHISAVVVDNTDVIVLSLFSTLNNVSIYSVYYLVVNAIRQLLVSLTGGIQSLFGNILANKEFDKLNHLFALFEIIFGFITTVLYSCTLCLIINFVKIYTNGITDVNYIVPLFAYTLTVSSAMYCYRSIYYTLIKSAGLFKETQTGAIIEVVINLTVSIILVIKYGLVGVALGTLVAVSYRTFYCVWFLSKNLISRSPYYFVKNLILNLLIMLISFFLFKEIKLTSISYLSWMLAACKIGIGCIFIATTGYLIAYSRHCINYLRDFKGLYG